MSSASAIHRRLSEATTTMWLFIFFFFQAEDGIRDSSVTGVQTCALPISVEWVLQAPEEQLRQGVDIDSAGKARFDHLGMHISLPGASILIDASMDEPDSPWGKRNTEQMGMVRTAGMVASLAQIGVVPEDITHVLL